MMDICTARDERIKIIKSLLSYEKVIISLRVNYPGPLKINQETLTVANVIHEEIKQTFNVNNFRYFESFEGPIYLYEISSNDPLDIKKRVIAIEDNHPLGRLVDIDVYYNTIKSISRRTLNLSPRKCFLCENEAFRCIVEKNHSAEEVIKYFNDKVQKFLNIPLDLMEFAIQAMLYEVSLEPSFGKVSPSTSGAHQDMDYHLFLDSISVISKYMLKFAQLGFQSKSINEMYDASVEIGKACEEAMFKKTKGVNTQKGLIFVLGLLIMSSAKVIYCGKDFSEIFTYVEMLGKQKFKELENLNRDNLTKGEQVYKQYNIGGVRFEASLGFPLIQEALKIIDLQDRTSFVKTFIYLMSKCDDTTIISRRGLDSLNYVKQVMSRLYLEELDFYKIQQVSEDFIHKGINPGGSCDLLCGTIFLKLVKNYIDNINK
ncbi:MAG: citrate lyase holo-[acyl-carrier protein] synthase [Bacilli bacterium]|nr:citrate lyase holo-[acyl-carrier protein] synthase [Bacilli bacterium]